MPKSTPVPALSLVDHNAARDLVHGRCATPFDVLGLHKRDAQWLLTVFQPGAETLICLTGAKTRKPMEPVPDYPGLFVLTFARAPKSYRLEATADGHSWTFTDTYSFGPVLGADDLHYIGEGTHQRLFQCGL